MSTSSDFSGRTVIVTGGARGIGLALSRFFARAGATVAVADVNEASLPEALVDELDGAIPLVSDVASSESVAAPRSQIPDGAGAKPRLARPGLRSGVQWEPISAESGTRPVHAACRPVSAGSSNDRSEGHVTAR